MALIWAMARNGVIGRDNALPWRLPADLQHFKALTTGHPVVMGRRTFESLGRPLPNRTNIVVSRDPAYAPGGARIAHSLDDALTIAAAALPPDRQVFVIGGENLYTQMLPRAERLHVTLVDADLDGDARFPDLDWQQWRELERRDHPADDRNRYACRFLTLERKTPHR
ncbi:MAG: dihydrofolate reductase [Comamonadaceae bacterium]|nr:dihydrofolate reductase [Comamonadaceae bacterium]